ncbi:hypothetical protein ZEAMMB73_Zm00001d004088 [Zea mays]|uniref:Uncharacterized protein n=1 Tax=Zea mays TaxID=4577 RepID=A0A1D6EDD2_MAIZE|nr:hypothetical protein ZEAMMB73_Zm00001d004088 [Zea mays]
MPPPPHDIAHPLFSLPSLSAVDVRSPGAIACAWLPPSLAPRWTSRLVWGHGSPTDRGSRRLMRSVSPPTLYFLAPCSTSFGCAEAVMVAVHVELDLQPKQ